MLSKSLRQPQPQKSPIYLSLWLIQWTPALAALCLPGPVDDTGLKLPGSIHALMNCPCLCLAEELGGGPRGPHELDMWLVRAVQALQESMQDVQGRLHSLESKPQSPTQVRPTLLLTQPLLSLSPCLPVPRACGFCWGQGGLGWWLAPCREGGTGTPPSSPLPVSSEEGWAVCSLHWPWDPCSHISRLPEQSSLHPPSC